ncbi:TPA: hypothetical protein J1413_004796 [Escherichia coli]|nr:hypothetical protein [Escherichia coli]HBA9522971.1 hypothetical protein [Escherichia coli]HBA9550906.1 hypothetical protein [Escherichia coli]HBA9560404.1 hypothetical protein [Escherichia coli]
MSMKVNNAHVSSLWRSPKVIKSGIGFEFASMVTNVNQSPLKPEQSISLFSKSSSFGVKDGFVKLFENHKQEKNKELYEDLDNYLAVPPIELSKMDLCERALSSTSTGITISWVQTSPAFIPSEEEKVPCGMLVSKQFIADVNRGDYVIEFPGPGDNKIEMDKKMLIEEKINKILIGAFGKHHIKQISEIANQAHMADFAAVAAFMSKDNYVVLADDTPPQFIIKKQEDGTYAITSSKIFNVKNIFDGETVEGLTITMTRTNTLRPSVKDSTQLLSGAKEEKDGMKFKIQYVKKNTPTTSKIKHYFWQKLRNIGTPSVRGRTPGPADFTGTVANSRW